MELSCGHEPTPTDLGTGYARMADGRTLCYPCAGKAEAEIIANGATYFHGYVPSLTFGASVTTWSGWALARITGLERHGRRYTPTGGCMDMVTVWAETPDGRYWWGRFNRSGGDQVTMRACKGSR